MLRTFRWSAPVAVLLLSLTSPGCVVAEGEGEGEEGEGEGEEGEGEEGEGEEGEGEGEVPDAREELPPALIDAVKAAGAVCLNNFVGLDTVESAEDIATFTDTFLDQFIRGWQRRVNDGSVTLDDDAVAACIADLLTPACFTNIFPLEMVSECDAIFVGALPVGAVCEQNVQCASGNCNNCVCDTGTPPTPRDSDTIVCNVDLDCGANAVCGFGEEDRVCVPVCDADADCPADQGCFAGRCEFDVDGAQFCDSNSDCADGLVCADDACVAPRVVGDDCDFSCGADDLICDFADGTCKAAPGEGEACVSFDCADGFTCNDDNDCVAAPAIGEACAGSDCAAGAFCDFNDEAPLCAATKALGEDCDNEDACGDDVCDFDRGGVCVSSTRAALDADCSTSLCDEALVCAAVGDEQLCRPLQLGAALGDPCSRLRERATCGFLQTCGVDNTCVATVVVDEGACTTNPGIGPICRGGFFGQRGCFIDEGADVGVCGDLPGRGDSCDTVGRCADGDICDFDPVTDGGVCGAGPALGDSCDDDFQCGALACEGGSCVAIADLDEGFVAGSCVPFDEEP